MEEVVLEEVGSTGGFWRRRNLPRGVVDGGRDILRGGAFFVVVGKSSTLLFVKGFVLEFSSLSSSESAKGLLPPTPTFPSPFSSADDSSLSSNPKFCFALFFIILSFSSEEGKF